MEWKLSEMEAGSGGYSGKILLGGVWIGWNRIM